MDLSEDEGLNSQFICLVRPRRRISAVDSLLAPLHVFELIKNHAQMFSSSALEEVHFLDAYLPKITSLHQITGSRLVSECEDLRYGLSDLDLFPRMFGRRKWRE